MKVILGRKILGPWGPKMLRYHGKSPRWSGKSYQLTIRLSMTMQKSWFLMVRHGKTTCIPLEDPTTLLVTNTIYLWYFGRAVVCGYLTSCGLAAAKRLVTLLSLFRDHLAKRWTSSIFVSSAQRKQNFSRSKSLGFRRSHTKDHLPGKWPGAVPGTVISGQQLLPQRSGRSNFLRIHISYLCVCISYVYVFYLYTYMCIYNFKILYYTMLY